MSDILPIVENQLENWRATGDPESLHRGFLLLTNTMERRDEAERRQQQLDVRHQELIAESNLLKTEIKSLDKRFDDTLHHMDKRFESMDKRFDDTLHHMDKRFESMDRRFNQLTWMIGIGFTVVVTIASLYYFL